MSARGLFDIPVDEDGWERPLPPSTTPWKAAPPPNQPKFSDSWKLASSPPKTVEVPKPQPPPRPNPEPELAMPSFWKPSWDGDSEPPTPQVPPISRLVTVEDVPDDPEPAAPAPVPIPKTAKPVSVPAQQPIPMKSHVPTVPEEPTPIWGQPWRKGQSCFLLTNDFSLTTWQQENRQFLTLRRTRPRNPFRSLLRYPLLSKKTPLHHRSLPPLQNLPLYPPQPPRRRRPNPRQPNSFGRRRLVKAKTRQQRR